MPLSCSRVDRWQALCQDVRRVEDVPAARGVGDNRSALADRALTCRRYTMRPLCVTRRTKSFLHAQMHPIDAVSASNRISKTRGLSVNVKKIPDLDLSFGTKE